MTSHYNILVSNLLGSYMVGEALELLRGIFKDVKEFEAVCHGLGVHRYIHVYFDALEQLLVALPEGVHLVVEARLVRGQEHLLFIGTEVESACVLPAALRLLVAVLPVKHLSIFQLV